MILRSSEAFTSRITRSLDRDTAGEGWQLESWSFIMYFQVGPAGLFTAVRVS